jgi:hypothetical protein
MINALSRWVETNPALAAGVTCALIGGGAAFGLAAVSFMAAALLGAR